MIAYLRGKVLTTTAETAILDVNGVGYEVYCSGGAFRTLTVGAVGELYTYLQVKEDGITLFGFDSPKEKELFLKLISVSGVGPKLGISILATLSADDFAMAIATADVKRLSAVKGLGKKTAEKIVLELHGKISALEVLGASEDELTPSPTAKTAANAKLSAQDEEAVSALMGLGFTRAESVNAVKKAHELGAKTVDEIILKALQGGM
jgi:Holliday junction DNA helicase RuvA